MAITEGVVDGVLPKDGSAAPKFTHGYHIDAESKLYFPRLDNVTAKNVKVALYDSLGNPLLIADDAAFTPGTSRVLPIGAFADEVAPDSVDEGDAGALRMTLARILRVALSTDAGASIHKTDDAAFTPATDTVIPIGAMADESGTDSVDEGDVGIPRMTLDRKLHVAPNGYDGSSAYTPLRAGVSGSVAGYSHAGVLAVVPHGYTSNGSSTVVGAQMQDFQNDGRATAQLVGQNVHAVTEAYNGTTLDKWRNNTEGTLLAGAARTAETGSSDQVNYNARGVIAILNVTVASGTGGLSCRIQGKDPISGSYYFIDTSPTAITVTGIQAYMVYPGASAPAQSAGGVRIFTPAALPRTWRLLVTVGDASSYTYSVGFALVV